MNDTIEINGRTRYVLEIVKKTNLGYKRNCHHKMSTNESMNIWTDRHEDFRRCIKNCGFWNKKTIYFDTDRETKNLIDREIKKLMSLYSNRF